MLATGLHQDVAARPDYAAFYTAFSPADVAAKLSGDLEAGINVCVECCDAHVAGGGIALEWEGLNGERVSLSFAELRDQASRFANVITALGVKPGDVVAGMLPRTPELLVTILGTWRAGAVYQPLFTAFGPKAIEQRLQTSRAKLVVTDPTNRPKLDDVANRPQVAVVARGESVAAGDIDFTAALAAASSDFAPVMRKGDDLFLMMSTSGTTGLPKGMPVPIRALLPFRVYMQYALDLRPRDKYWNIADPGWAYGLYYAVTGPLLLGHTTTFYEGPFTAESTYRIIASHGITNLAGAPTAYRLLMAAGLEAAAPVKGQLRAVSSAGEPLNPEVIRWFRAALDAPICDHYGQTEMGMVVNNHHGLEHKQRAGSAGLSIPGFRVVIIGPDDVELGPDTLGDLAVDLAASPLFWFTGYYNKETPSLGPKYYRTGDLAELGPDGLIAFVGRNDDVITSSGYRIGPFDVESALIEHLAVVEAGVVGKPDPERTEIVKAFVVLKPDIEPSDALAEELRLHVRKRLSAHAYPREIEFVEQLPKTPSGKLQRFMLRAREKQNH
jgi:acetyl-CoA synthetase